MVCDAVCIFHLSVELVFIAQFLRSISINNWRVERLRLRCAVQCWFLSARRRVIKGEGHSLCETTPAQCTVCLTVSRNWLLPLFADWHINNVVKGLWKWIWGSVLKFFLWNSWDVRHRSENVAVASVLVLIVEMFVACQYAKYEQIQYYKSNTTMNVHCWFFLLFDGCLWIYVRHLGCVSFCLYSNYILRHLANTEELINIDFNYYLYWWKRRVILTANNLSHFLTLINSKFEAHVLFLISCWFEYAGACWVVWRIGGHL
jgi:hypothetical protein